MSREKFDSILQRYLNNQCTDAERKYIESWFNATQRTEIKDLDLSQQAQLRNKLWNSIELGLIPAIGKAPSSPYWRLSKVAASILLVAASIFSLSYYLKTRPLERQPIAGLTPEVEMTHVSNTDNTILKLELKDGSTVLLHPHSEIRYPIAFGLVREVYLIGEAFFEIEKDPQHPFLVHAAEITTKVLGTSFLVKAYKDQKEIIVDVKTGRVSVFSTSLKNKIVLLPNQQAVYKRNEDQIVKGLVAAPQIILPVPTLEMYYDGVPVKEVFDALQKNYGVEIKYNEESLSNCTLTTEMTDEGLYERIEIICHAIGAEYKIEQAAIVIKASGCI